MLEEELGSMVCPDEIETMHYLGLEVSTFSNYQAELYINWKNPCLNRYRNSKTGKFISEEEYSLLCEERVKFIPQGREIDLIGHAYDEASPEDYEGLFDN